MFFSITPILSELQAKSDTSATIFFSGWIVHNTDIVLTLDIPAHRFMEADIGFCLCCAHVKGSRMARV